MKVVLLLAAAVSFVIGATALWIGFQHNSQMEFFDTATGKIDYQYSALLFVTWFVISFVIVGGVGAAILLIFRSS